MIIVFLGTGSAVPTKKRNHTSIFLNYDGDRFLWDCGEGTQRQMTIDGLSPTKINRIFITHWHADHFAGLLGLIQTLHLENRKRPLYIYGPQVFKFLDILLELSYLDFGFKIVGKEVPWEGTEISEILDEKKYKIFSIPTKHSIPSVAYCFQEKDRWNINLKKAEKLGLKPGPKMMEIKKYGKIKIGNKTILLKDVAEKTPGRKVVYSGDTRPCENVVKLSKNADILIHESTFEEGYDLSHSTSEDAAKIAKKSKVKKLILIHFSKRYKSLEKMLKKAKKIFPNTELSEDFKKVKV